MRRLTLTFTDQEAEELITLAREERRRPHDQAAILVANGLRERRPFVESDTPVSAPDNAAATAAGETCHAPR